MPAATSAQDRDPQSLIESQSLIEIARAVMSIPTASYVEHGVLAYLRSFASDCGLDYAEDRYGNAYLSYRRGRARRRPLVLGAHLDHPGFVITTVGSDGSLGLEFRGGLSATYGAGERVRLYRRGAGDACGTATITSVAADERGRITGATAVIEGGPPRPEVAPGDLAPGDMALWDVPVFRRRGHVIHARQCDDLAGAAAILATLGRVAAAGRPGHLIGLFTRAEETGLRGASVVGRERLLPDDAIVVAVETSSMAGGRAEQGGGPIVRVGDAVHIFSPAVTQWMTALAQELASEDGTFRYQRRLMDGGVTEATAYDLYGYETGAACVALGHYHNAGPRGRVAAETIHLDDLEGLVRLFLRMHDAVPQFGRALPALRSRYDRLGREAATALRRTRQT